MIFFFNDTATTEIYTLTLHDALPICRRPRRAARRVGADLRGRAGAHHDRARSEEHTSELQSRLHLVCRLLLEKKKLDNLAPIPSTLPSCPTVIHVSTTATPMPCTICT